MSEHDLFLKTTADYPKWGWLTEAICLVNEKHPGLTNEEGVALFTRYEKRFKEWFFAQDIRQIQSWYGSGELSERAANIKF